MIKVITDNGVTIETANIAELKDRIDEIFLFDPRDNVLVTYVVTKNPTSRRIAPTT